MVSAAPTIDRYPYGVLYLQSRWLLAINVEMFATSSNLVQVAKNKQQALVATRTTLRHQKTTESCNRTQGCLAGFMPIWGTLVRYGRALSIPKAPITPLFYTCR